MNELIYFQSRAGDNTYLLYFLLCDNSCVILSINGLILYKQFCYGDLYKDCDIHLILYFYCVCLSLIKKMNSSLMKNVSAPSFSSYEVTRDWIVLFLYFITAMVGIFGNIYVCLVIYNKKKLRSTTYMLVLNMAISDILGGIVIPSQWLFCATFFLETGNFALRLCNITNSLQILSYYVSTFTMTAIAFDRYRLICRPLSTRMGPWIPIIITWVLGLLFVSTTFFSMRIAEYFSPTQGIIGCRVVFSSKIGLIIRKVRALLIIVTQYIIPLTITITLYGFVVYTVRKRECIGTVSETKKKSLDESKKRTIKMLILVTAIFGLAWLPVWTILFLKFFTNLLPIPASKCNATTINYLSYWLGLSSCACNPFIYFHFNDDFKSEAIRYYNYIIPWRRIEQIEKDKKHDDSSGGNITASSSDYHSTDV